MQSLKLNQTHHNLTPTMSNTPTTTTTTEPPNKRHLHDQNHKDLIPGIPDHIAQLCLSLLRPSLLYNVCSSWRRLIYSPSYPPFLSLYAILSKSPPPPSSAIQQTNSSSIQFYNFDPISSNWNNLPPPPPDLQIDLLLHHPSFLSRNLPIQSVSVSGNLVLLAATTHNLYPALTCPLIFNPLSRVWNFGPPLAAPRRWCALGASRGAVYVASGIGSQFSIDVARSLEKWDFQQKAREGNKNPNAVNVGGEWEKKSALKDGRFSRDAIDAVGWKGKLCMVNVKGDAAKEGIVYDVEKDMWEEMRGGMISGWRGPVAAMGEEVMYGVDEVNGALRKYDDERDEWVEILESERLKGADKIAAEGGRVCVVCGGGITVVDVVASPARLWVIDLPAGFQAVAIHILPRFPVSVLCP